MKQLFEYFQFTHKEQLGVKLLLFLLILLLFAHINFPRFAADETLVYTLVEEKSSIKDEHVKAGRPLFRTNKRSESIPEYFYFDPNKLPESGWLRLGLKPGQVRGIMKYREKGGKFRKASELGKLYSLSEADVARLLPYVRLEAESPVDSMPKPFNSLKTTVIHRREAELAAAIDINLADSLEWVSLKGIGPVFAGRILRFREALGGFHSPEQIKEVYGISPGLYDLIRPQLMNNSQALRKIPINSVPLEILATHPYLSYKLARTIINFRTQHGPFLEIEDLKRIHSLNAEIFLKIEPYLVL